MAIIPPRAPSLPPSYRTSPSLPPSYRTSPSLPPSYRTSPSLPPSCRTSPSLSSSYRTSPLLPSSCRISSCTISSTCSSTNYEKSETASETRYRLKRQYDDAIENQSFKGYGERVLAYLASNDSSYDIAAKHHSMHLEKVVFRLPRQQHSTIQDVPEIDGLPIRSDVLLEMIAEERPLQIEFAVRDYLRPRSSLASTLERRALYHEWNQLSDAAESALQDGSKLSAQEYNNIVSSFCACYVVRAFRLQRRLSSRGLQKELELAIKLLETLDKLQAERSLSISTVFCRLDPFQRALYFFLMLKTSFQRLAPRKRHQAMFRSYLQSFTWKQDALHVLKLFCQRHLRIESFGLVITACAALESLVLLSEE